jgi:Domain of unknown function (DUF4157)
MSEDSERSRLYLNREASQPKPPVFQEAPGEADAEAVRDAFLKGAGPKPEDVAAGLTGADAVTRARAISRLQQERGNAYVQRVIVEAQGSPGRLVGLSQPEMVDEVASRKGGGSSLPEEARTQMEGFFGADLGGVRVHADGGAATLNRELDAQAFTVGSDVFFAEGKYNPASAEGQGLLAHELTHVGQQGGFGAPEVQRAAEEEEPKPSTEAAVAPIKPEEEST